LAAMSHLHDSVEEPEYTTNVNGVWTLRILRQLDY
jgi:GDP-D-mannose dehydratase